MKKRIFGRKLNRTGSHRWAMLRNMVTSLIKHERIVTTTPKAKTVAPLLEKMVTFAKGGTLAHRRLAGAVVREEPMLTKLFGIIGPRYTDRAGGYTRIVKLSGHRKGDAADMAVVEFVDREGELRQARPAVKARVGLGGLVDEYEKGERKRIEKGEGEKKRHPGLNWMF